MPGKISANDRDVIHQASGHKHVVFPDVCKTPPYSIPVPYPNLAQSIDATGGPKTVTFEGSMPVVVDSPYTKTSGDEAGSSGGVISGVNRAEARFVIGSFDIKIEGRLAARAGDPMFHNMKNGVG